MPEPGSQLQQPPRAHTLIAFDFGLKRIGVAVGDTLTARAAPRPAILMLSRGPDWSAIEREVRAHAPALLIVGVPYNADGTAGALAGAARGFGAALHERLGLPVAHVDERGSSLEANAALSGNRASGARRRRVRRGDVDSAAAAVILERWLAGEREGNVSP
ncbi:MAG TPA: Holliday junction resolvase RuvX [Steroidobacteraceae bacterium]|nr:Holliday junction resolvase RuvX [Steroidobacteraceae bacterium]